MDLLDGRRETTSQVSLHEVEEWRMGETDNSFFDYPLVADALLG